MRQRSILLAATLLAAAGAGAAVAEGVAVYDPAQLPAMTGQVAQYSLTPRGDVDGVILQDGTQVHLPPHLGPQLVQAVKPGDQVTIHGLKAKALPLVQALSIKGEASGRTVVDTGPPGGPPGGPGGGPAWEQVAGKVREPLYGPRGDMNGALLEDGTQVHVPPRQAESVNRDLQTGRTLVAQGYGLAGPYGHSLDAQKIGPTAEQLVAVAAPPPPGHHGPGGPPGHGFGGPKPPGGFDGPPPGPPGGPPDDR